jgi:hypothetical protein
VRCALVLVASQACGFSSLGLLLVNGRQDAFETSQMRTFLETKHQPILMSGL